MNHPVDEPEYLDALNPEQRRAVTYTGGPVLIIAGAGSGKTRVLTYRIAYLIKEMGVSPREILAITFTNKAAQEMKQRVHRLVGISAQDMTIGTFHSACARILRMEIEVLGHSTRFSIYDELDSVRLIARCVDDLGLDRRQYHPRALKALISGAKNEMIDRDEFSSRVFGVFEEVASNVYGLYQDRLKENDALDFDDLLVTAVNLFELYPEVLARYRRRFRHVLVDEYQDTNIAQYRLVKLLADEHRNLCVVGDDDQGIYSWRGADIRNILEFEKDYPDARVFKLEQNYRSTPNILEVAGTVVSNNIGRKGKTLWTANPPGEKVRYYMAEDEHGEAGMVAGEIKSMVEQRGRGYSDMAVFYRTHAQSRVLEDAFMREGIPYRIFGGTRFYERSEIKDTVAYLRIIANPKDEVSLRRILNVPPRGIGAKSTGYIEAYGREHGVSLMQAIKDADEVNGLPPRARSRIKEFVRLVEDLTGFASEHEVDELIEEVWKRTGYLDELEAERTLEAEGRIENLRELINVVADFREQYGTVTLDDFLERVSLVNDTDEFDECGGYVSLMTLHNAKGLEFPVVFIVGMEENVFPHVRSMDERGRLEEERRLCYVGMTRAKEVLYLAHAAVRSVRGLPTANPMSRFLFEVPSEFLEPVDFEQDRPEPETLTELGLGDGVVHARWGPGVVVEITEQGDDCEVAVEFPELGVKRLLLRYAPLVKE